jgi:NADH-quinone oxidoreductase subunit F
MAAAGPLPRDAQVDPAAVEPSLDVPGESTMTKAEIFAKYPPQMENVLLLLHELQTRHPRNYLSAKDLDLAARHFKTPLATLYGIATYYSMFSLVPRGKHLIRICRSPACQLLGGGDLSIELERLLGIGVGETTADRRFTLEAVECLGLCELAPALTIDDTVYGGLTVDRLAEILRDLSPPAPFTAPGRAMRGQTRIALANVGRIDPDSLPAYVEAGGYQALTKVLAGTPQAVVAAIDRSGLRGRGGAGFSTGLKTRYTSEAACELVECLHHLVCNADEGEPGTFKDRLIMEGDPHRLIEGMLIAAYAVGARRAHIYIRGEYRTAIDRIRRALSAARAHGYLGPHILGSDFSLEIALKLGAGSYLCGEELTLLDSLEGKRGHPRIKPPFPAEAGLFGQPTLVNNVETLAHLPAIITNGPEWYRSLGTDTAAGTKIFTLSGDVNRPGAVEVEMGTSLRTLVEEFGGGVRAGRSFKAALLGGAAGTFVPAGDLDVAMDFEALEARGAVLGSGAVIVLGTGRSVADILVSILRFFRHESCGKCVPCRVGTTHLVNLMADLGESSTRRADKLDALLDQARRMAATSLCPLGQSPILAIESALRHFRPELETPPAGSVEGARS